MAKLFHDLQATGWLLEKLETDLGSQIQDIREKL